MSDDYEPTNNLRFVERMFFRGTEPPKSLRILQQWWCRPDDDSPTGHLNLAIGEWRDIPVVEL